MINLTLMTEDDFHVYLERAVRNYAEEHVRSGNWTEENALELSRKEYAGLLPDGIRTPDNFVFTLCNEEGEKVGFLWYAIHPKRPNRAYIYDFEIYEPFRRRGYATAALAALEQDAKSRALEEIELHVFGHNIAARALYCKVGFEETHVMMMKRVA